VQSLDAATLTLSTISGGTVTYSVNGDAFTRVSGTSTMVLATGVTSLALKYYNLNAGGTIIESTAPASAALITARITVAGKSAADKTQVFYGGAKLRNH
jgi:hypothetical protein